MAAVKRRTGSPTSAVAWGAGAVVVILAVALIAGLVTRKGGSSAADRRRAAAVVWDKQAGTAIGPLARALPGLANDVGKWQRGELQSAELKVKLGDARTVFASSESSVLALGRSPAGPSVNRGYVQSAALDRAWVDVMSVAVDLPPGALRDQVALAGQRMRELGDRVFDLGRTPLASLLPVTPPAGVEVVRPADVPDWVAEGLAPGPPLDDPPPPASGQPSVRQATRPQQSRAAWAKAVRDAKAPDAEVSTVVDHPETVPARDVARALQAAVDRLRNAPDPAGQREAATGLYLRWLTEAEASRLAQASTLVPGPSAATLAAVAKQVLRTAVGIG
jgi:hypothetical protein